MNPAILAAIVGAALALGLGALIVWLLARLVRARSENAESSAVERKLETLEHTFQKINDMTFRELAELKRDISGHLQSSRQTMDSSSHAMHERVRDFTASVTKMHELFREVNDSVQRSTEKMLTFQNIFRTPKLRGQWGEANLENMLKQIFPPELILRQHYFKNGEAVDFAIRLPNDLLLPVDAKFPLETYVAYAEENDEQLRSQHMQLFARRVKEETDAVASKYIRPEEGTSDLALLFIPAEAVYYDILFGLRDLGLQDYAWKKRVIITSPNTLLITLAAIQHWYRDTTVSKRTQEIRKRLGTIIGDSKKLSESYERLGKHIENTKSAYETSGKRIELLTGRIERVIVLGEEPALPADKTLQE